MSSTPRQECKECCQVEPLYQLDKSRYIRSDSQECSQRKALYRLFSAAEESLQSVESFRKSEVAHSKSGRMQARVYHEPSILNATRVCRISWPQYRHSTANVADSPAKTILRCLQEGVWSAITFSCGFDVDILSPSTTENRAFRTHSSANMKAILLLVGIIAASRASPTIQERQLVDEYCISNGSICSFFSTLYDDCNNKFDALTFLNKFNVCYCGNGGVAAQIG